MAYDTIGLRSPFVSEEVAQVIEKQCVLRQGVDLNTGDVLYAITTGSLEGSHDSRISIKVERERWEAPKVKTGLAEWAIPSSEKGEVKTRSNFKAPPVRTPCEPFIYIEASVHKALAGHNICGGPEGFRECSHWLIGLVEELLGVKLPDPDIWEARRIDVAEVFQLPSYEACEEYFRGLNAASYPRRSVTRYEHNGIYAQGSTTTLKFYHKGPEFLKHDKKRLAKILKSDKLFELIDLAHKTIRVEVEIKTRKLESMFQGRSPLVKEISDADLLAVYDLEVQRFLKEGAKEMELVRDAQSVQRRLRQVYDDRLAGLLFGTWYQLTTLGEKFVKENFKRRTYYLHRKQLVEAGVSWHGTDVVLQHNSAVPVGFSPVRSNPHRNIAELVPVALKLAPIRNKLDFINVGSASARKIG